MARPILRLDEDVVNRIAAGEVSLLLTDHPSSFECTEGTAGK